MQTNYMSWQFNSRRPDPSDLHGEGTIVNNRWRITGFSNDWCYMHAGIHSVSPEVEGSAPDYNGDGFIRPDEIGRWHREEKGGQFFSPWKRYNHPVLGEVEIGGSRGIPAALDDTARMHSEWQYDLLRHIADFSPLLKIVDLTSEPISGGKYRVVATLQNQGFLATYITRNALKIRRDYPVNARIQVTGGEVVEGETTKNVGHLPGKLTVIGHWSEGQDVPTKTVEWTIEAAGSEPLEVSVEAWAPKAGRDQQVITIEKSGTETNPFPKHVEVFGVHVYATAAAPDDKVLHAANVLAEYLDSDEDGIPDNQKIVDAMIRVNATLVVGKNSRDLRAHDRPWHNSQGVYTDEIFPLGQDGRYDGALEEVLHLITDNGWYGAYPSVFGRVPGTEVAKASEAARGGRFEEVPDKYPEGAWHTYYSESCDYDCQISEYIHWGLTSILGGHERYWKELGGKDQWDLRTKEKVQSGDPTLYALLTDPQYKLPTVLPDGKYRAKTFTIRPVAAESRTIDDHDRGLSEHFRIEARPFERPDFEIIPLDNLNGVLDRKILVFGIPVFAYSGVSDEDLVRTAHVTAQWLDNDENGNVDNRLILDELAKHNAYVFIVENQEQVNSYNFQNNTAAYSLDAESINRDWYSEKGPTGRADGTMEEPFHMISDVGYGNLYPDVFSTRKGSELANAMDIARGGQFERTPDKYPDGAWYTYDDKSCRYGCMAAEYFYWGMISILGVNDNRGDAIKGEWKLYTRELVESKDPRLFSLLTNRRYKFPTKAPDGTYGQ